MNLSFTENKTSFLLIGIGIAVILLLVAIVNIFGYQFELTLLSILLLFLLLLILNKKFYITMVILCPFIFLFAQIPESIFEFGRWIILFTCSIVGLILLIKNNYPLLPNNVVIAFLLVGLYSILTSSYSYYPIITAYKGFSLILFVCYVLFALNYINIKTLGKAKYFYLRLYYYIAIFIILSNTLYFIIYTDTAYHADRFRGWFTNPNGIGAVYGIFLIPILFSEITNSSRKKNKILPSLILLIAIIQIIYSQSRAGILAGFVGILSFIIYRYFGVKRINLLLIIILLITIAYIYTPENIINRYVFRNELEVTGSMRLIIWTRLLDNIEDNLWLGSGLGVADTGIPQESIVYKTANYTLEKANSYLGMVEELGVVISTVFLLLTIISFLKKNHPIIRTTDDESRHLMITIIAIIYAGLVNALFEGWMLAIGGFISLSFWTFFSLLMLKDMPQNKALPNCDH